MTRQFGSIDPEKVQRVVDRCPKDGINEFNALGAVVQTAYQHDIDLSPDEEGEAAQELLAMRQ
ncbi:MAG TPA: hypothetical protein VJ608_11515 [Albitalea sp.]|nr:hypothetical protein [Albitalea sp.]